MHIQYTVKTKTKKHRIKVLFMLSKLAYSSDSLSLFVFSLIHTYCSSKLEKGNFLLQLIILK